MRGVGFALPEVVDQVDDDVGTACLHGEGVVLVVEHVPVESEAELHKYPRASVVQGAKIRGERPANIMV